MNKNVLLTGGNRGTGKAAVKKLAERGMTVTLTTARDRKKGDAVAAEVRAEVPNAKVDCRALDGLDPSTLETQVLHGDASDQKRKG